MPFFFSHRALITAFYLACTAFFFIASIRVPAQSDMQAISYNLSNVLPTDLVKSTIQDKRGFLWAGTDMGMIRFDGRHSTAYRNLPSLYIKGLARMATGDVLIATDMGLVRLQEDRDSVRFPTVIAGSTTKNDTTLFYPKSIFIASNGDVWIGEPDAIVRVRFALPSAGKSFGKASMKRFPFARKYESDSFARTFSFVEDGEKILIVCSQRGAGLFRFDVVSESFIEIPVQGAIFDAASAIMLRNMATNTLWIGTVKGIFAVSLGLSVSKQMVRTWQQISPISDVSCFAKDSTDNVYIGTWSLGLYRVESGQKQLQRMDAIDSKTINNLSYSHDGNIWISADDGINILHPYTFVKPNVPFSRPYIQNVILSPDGSILASDGNMIFRINPYSSQQKVEEIFQGRKINMPGSIISLAERNGQVWFSNSVGLLGIVEKGAYKVVRQVQASEYYSFITHDSRGNTWLSQSPNLRLSLIQADGSMREYGVAQGLTAPANVIRESQQSISAKSAQLYVGGTGVGTYLFRYSASADRFENISPALPFTPQGGFIVNDLVVVNDTSIWLATNQGVFHCHNKQTDTIPFSAEIARKNIPAIAYTPKGGVLFATGQGVYMYIQQELIAVDLRLGKMVMSPSFRNLALDNAGQLWLGTKQGLLFSQKFAKLVPETPVPMIVDIQANGVIINAASQTTFTSGLYLQAEFTSLCYPAEKIRYQTRLVRVNSDGSFVDADTAWSEAHREAEQLFPSILTGEYVLHIRAQQEGYLWSVPTNYRFSVQPTLYVRWWAILSYLVLIIALMYGTARWWAWRLERKNRVLKRMVEERTQEIQRQVFILDEQAREIELANTRLQEQNVQLIELNNEKNDFLGIAAHDLKNPLTGIMMTVSTMRNYFDRMTRDDLTTQLLRIENTARRMHSIITELLDVNAIETGNFTLHLTDFDITPTVQQVVEDFRERAAAKAITLHLEVQPNVKLVNADATAIVQVLENIISNAVKYSPNDKNVFVSVADNGSHTVRVFVRDEGPGLSPEDKERLFVKFAKLSARPTAGESSTGLGLSIVKRMVEAMHGQVLCESELGDGATFILEFAAAVGQK